EYRKMRLKHIESIQGNLMTSPNDITAIGERHFYVTNDHGATSPLGRKAEDYLRLSISYVLFFDGSEFRKVAGDMSYANGMALSNDKRTLYVSSTVGGLIRLFSRDKKSGDLKFIKDIVLKTGVDNLNVDNNGNLWVGCHPKLLTFVKHSKDPLKRSPSQILKIRFNKTGGYSVDEVYLNSGKEISGSSVGVLYRDRFLIGSVFENRFLDCRLVK
ncbi:SMP-30/gluconolactonase/LRE family protein, partial [bacterium]|nr:SMP-30/gluconolactonase/LRE family protein [bacterium]